MAAVSNDIITYKHGALLLLGKLILYFHIIFMDQVGKAAGEKWKSMSDAVSVIVPRSYEILNGFFIIKFVLSFLAAISGESSICS